MTQRASTSFIYWMRPFLILSIVIGHGFAVYDGTWTIPNGVPNGPTFYQYLNSLMISFHLPAFFFISGYLFRYKDEDRDRSLGKYWIYVKKKSFRLFVPGVVFSLLYVASFENPHNMIIVVRGMLMGAGHLWFLPLLFGISVSYRAISNYIMHSKYTALAAIIFCISFCVVSVGKDIPLVPGLRKSVFYFLFFLLGDYYLYFLSSKRFFLPAAWKGTVSFFLFGIFWWLGIVYSESLPDWAFRILRLAYISLGLVGSLHFSNVLAQRYVRIPKLLSFLNESSFPVYIIHQFVMKFFLFYLIALGYTGNELLFPFLLLGATFVSTYLLVISLIQVFR